MGRTKQDEYLHGVAWALSVLTKGFGMPNLAAMIAAEGPFWVADFRAAGVEECDLEEWSDDLLAMAKRMVGKAEKKRSTRRMPATARGPQAL